MSFSQISPIPEIKDVELGSTIGNGAFACVKSACLKSDPSVVFAVKFVHIPTCKNTGLSEKDITKEVVLQSRCSKNDNVLKVIDCNISDDFMWIVLEMADGGDLFDKIEPDVGVDSEVAQFYFQQLIRAVSYLHDECGIAHRDIKPENILLDGNGNLKLADFGLAYQYRRKDGSIRISTDQRGSPPYMAPEILHSNAYLANITDIWSIGILLFVLLTGEILWELPVFDDENFENFIKNEGNIYTGPWTRLDFNHMNLLRKILQPNPEKRVSLETLKLHPWFTSQVRFADENGLCNNPSLLARKLLSNLKVSLSDNDYFKFTQDVNMNEKIPYRLGSTQPINNDLAQIQHDSLNVKNYSFTQQHSVVPDSGGPTGQRSYLKQDLDLTKKLLTDVAVLQFCDERDPNFSSSLVLNKTNITKFYTLEEMDIILPLLETALQIVHVKVKPDLYGQFSTLFNTMGDEYMFPVTIGVKTEDRNGYVLTGSIIIAKLEDPLKSVDFERRSGDPLEWRRLFKRIALCCRGIILVPGANET
ncbi:hypothetical protein Kpol_1035p17 [Vanderwaltozyma polyspora DSM 70294]|uniref:non-specific serine/threonine protein kinase n=1 Tax=Vanderwaltozyma polyspora (strain ATCC 22028 / DSM 70294 / BCRC 21397 / CBS 2163 / NBRC 10782 / NRRL Y-8283 / UCD 57-17) TaxID=436907 RepID=A7TKI2_VANPO|nr:uncharacterized protein Kpol_1035p17 [Vanderwaltozyma polyspora DSM 70294]EDO17204.1 hypothetical protein Kpol_1035p17 [Vanderwaltozyma polyspora DSM 70294]